MLLAHRQAQMLQQDNSSATCHNSSTTHTMMYHHPMTLTVMYQTQCTTSFNSLPLKSQMINPTFGSPSHHQVINLQSCTCPISPSLPWRCFAAHNPITECTVPACRSAKPLPTQSIHQQIYTAPPLPCIQQAVPRYPTVPPIGKHGQYMRPLSYCRRSNCQYVCASPWTAHVNSRQLKTCSPHNHQLRFKTNTVPYHDL